MGDANRKLSRYTVALIAIEKLGGEQGLIAERALYPSLTREQLIEELAEKGYVVEEEVG